MKAGKVIFLILFIFQVYSFAFKPTNICIVNYTNFVLPPDAIITMDIYYEIEEADHGDEEEPIFVLVKDSSFLKKYEIGEDLPFQILEKGKVRVFVPLKRLKSSGILHFSILEGGKELISTNVTFTLDKRTKQKPIILHDKLNNLELPKSKRINSKIFFISTYSITPKVVINGKKYNLKVFSDERFRILKYLDFTFTNTGLFKFIFDNDEIFFNVSEDKTPPYFELLIPSNNAVFYSTNILIKWTDPKDVSGINFSESYLTIRGENFITNIAPLLSLNRESLISDYEILRISIPYGKYSLEIKYSDNSDNNKIVSYSFSVNDKSEDKEKPYVTKFHVEEVIKENEVYVSNKTNVVLFIETDDGVYGSGLSKVHYFLNGTYQYEPMVGNSKYLNIYLDRITNHLSFFVEDNNSNFSKTNSLVIVLSQ